MFFLLVYDEDLGEFVHYTTAEKQETIRTILENAGPNLEYRIIHGDIVEASSLY